MVQKLHIHDPIKGRVAGRGEAMPTSAGVKLRPTLSLFLCLASFTSHLPVPLVLTPEGAAAEWACAIACARGVRPSGRCDPGANCCEDEEDDPTDWCSQREELDDSPENPHPIRGFSFGAINYVNDTQDCNCATDYDATEGTDHTTKPSDKLEHFYS